MQYKEILHRLLLKKYAKQKRLVAPKPMSLKKHRVPESTVESSTTVIQPNSPTALPIWVDNHHERYLGTDYVSVTVARGKWLNVQYCAAMLMFDGEQALKPGDTILYNPTEIMVGGNGDLYQTIRPTTIYVNTQSMWYHITLK